MMGSKYFSRRFTCLILALCFLVPLFNVAPAFAAPVPAPVPAPAPMPAAEPADPPATGADITPEQPVATASAGFHKDTPAQSIEKIRELSEDFIVDNETQPTFTYSAVNTPATGTSIIYEEVWIEVPCDTDENGTRDLVRIQIARPAETGEIIDPLTGETAVSVPVLMEHSPYRVGATTRNIPLFNVWLDQSANPSTAGLTYADVRTVKPRADNWSWTLGASYWDKSTKEWKDDTEGGDPSWYITAREGIANGAWFIPESRGDREVVFQGNRPATHTSLGDIAQYFYTRGYAYVHSASIGNDFNEPGWEGFSNCGNVEETLPAMAIIKWLNGDPSVKGYTDREATKEVVATWCNGSVAMTGASYVGTLPIATAMSGVEGLKAILPVAAISSWYNYYRGNGAVVAPGGWQGEDANYLAVRCFALGATNDDIPELFWEYLGQMAEGQSRATGDYNSFWDDRNYLTTVESVRDDCGIMVMHGLNDWNVKTTHADLLYRAMKGAGKTIKELWHLGAHTTDWKRAESFYLDYFHLWLDHFLYGLDNGAVEDIPEVNIPSNNNLNWESYDSWPIAGTTYQKYYLNAPTASSAGAMTETAPAAGTAGKIKDDRKANAAVTTEYTVPPTPTDYNRSGIVSAQLNAWENRLFDPAMIDMPSKENERLAFAIDLKKPLRINGTVKVGLELSSDVDWGTISVALVEVGLNYRDRDDVAANVINSGFGTVSIARSNYVSNATRSQFKIVTRGHVDLQNPNPSQAETYLEAKPENGFVPDYYFRTTEIEPDTDYKYYFTMEPMDYTFKAGTRLAIYVYTSDYRYTQVAKDIVPEMTIKTGAGTFVELPVVPTYSIFYNANGGTSDYSVLGGYSDAYPIEGQSELSRNPGYRVATAIGNTSLAKISLRTGYEFVGWNTKADGTGTAYDVGDVIADDEMSDLTLYAQWYRPPAPPVTPGGPIAPPPSPPPAKAPGLPTAEVDPVPPGGTAQDDAVRAAESLNAGWTGEVSLTGLAMLIKLPKDEQTVVTLGDLPGVVNASGISTMAILNADGTLTPVPTRIIAGKIIVILEKDATIVPLRVDVTFSDLSRVTAEVRAEINKAATYMIVQGFPGGEFRPGESVTVQQAVTMFLRASGIRVEFETAMATEAANRYIGSGMPAKALMSRVQAAQLIANALAHFGLRYPMTDDEIAEILEDFPDVGGLGGAELEALAICVKLGIFQGHADGTMAPNGIINRSQMASLSIRMQDVLFGLS